MRRAVELDMSLRYSELPRMVYCKENIYYPWFYEGWLTDPSMPEEPDIILWHINREREDVTTGYITGLSSETALIPEIPAETLGISVGYVKGQFAENTSAAVIVTDEGGKGVSAEIEIIDNPSIEFDKGVLEFATVSEQRSAVLSPSAENTYIKVPEGVFISGGFIIPGKEGSNISKGWESSNGSSYMCNDSGAVVEDYAAEGVSIAEGISNGKAILTPLVIYINVLLTSGSDDGSSPENAFRGGDCFSKCQIYLTGLESPEHKPLIIYCAGGLYHDGLGLSCGNRTVLFSGSWDASFTVQDKIGNPTVMTLRDVTKWRAFEFHVPENRVYSTAVDNVVFDMGSRDATSFSGGGYGYPFMDRSGVMSNCIVERSKLLMNDGNLKFHPVPRIVKNSVIKECTRENLPGVPAAVSLAVIDEETIVTGCVLYNVDIKAYLVNKISIYNSSVRYTEEGYWPELEFERAVNTTFSVNDLRLFPLLNPNGKGATPSACFSCVLPADINGSNFFKDVPYCMYIPEYIPFNTGDTTRLLPYISPGVYPNDRDIIGNKRTVKDSAGNISAVDIGPVQRKL